MATSIVGSIDSCHVVIADACIVHSMIKADGSDVAAISDLPPEMVVATIITVIIVPVVIIAIVVIVVAIITIVRISGWTKEQTKPATWVSTEMMCFSRCYSRS